MTEASNEQLQEIANFLNAHMFRIRDEFPDLDGFEPADSPTASTGYAIDETASGAALDLIGFLMNNPNASFEFSNTPHGSEALSFDSVTEFQDFFENLTSSNYIQVSSTLEAGSIRKDVHSIEFNSFPQATLVTTIRAMIPDANNDLECLNILNVKTVLEGNNTFFDWTQYDSENPNDVNGPLVEINESSDRVKISIDGVVKVGLNISGYPVKFNKLITVVITYNYSTAEVNPNLSYWYYTTN